MKIFKYILLSPVLAFLIFLSCNDTDPIQESSKSLEGSWKVVSLHRNGVDLTPSVDLSAFAITFHGDNTYTLENYIPFIVKDAGTYSLDDPQYPFKINFIQNSNAETVITDLTYPVVQGKRQIRLVFSPGCQLNSYEYVLEREED